MGRFTEVEIDWRPFALCCEGEKPPYPRSLQTPEGLGDRLRFVAFAEKQATHAFAIAAGIYPGLDPGVANVWRVISREEQKHLQWLLWRMEELGVDPAGRPQSLALWKSFDRCATAEEFAQFMANAEERGRVAGEQFHQTLLAIDPVTARIFGQIALEEREHIRLARSIIDLSFRIPPDFDLTVAGIPLDGYQALRSPG